MSAFVWLYDPEICEGDFCPKDCDICPKKELIFKKEDQEEKLDKWMRRIGGQNETD